VEAHQRVDRLVSAALRHHASSVREVKKITRRGRRSGWIPTLRMSGRRGQGRDLSQYATDDVDRTSLSSDDDLTLEVSMVFRLDRVLYGRDEYRLLRERRAVQQQRLNLIRTVVQLYFEGERLRRELSSRQAGEQARVRLAEIVSLLTALTGEQH
ncbi:MAG: hypothetical protein AAF550_04275, partial [Myxococcota bacterium]